MKKYILYSDYIRSRHDGDEHFVTANMLASLYGVRLDECYVVRPEEAEYQVLRGVKDPNSLIRLRVRYDGNYKLPEAQR